MNKENKKNQVDFEWVDFERQWILIVYLIFS